MKVIGAFLLVMSTSLCGLYFVKLYKSKIGNCADLLDLCDALIIAVTYSKIPIKNVLLESSLKRYFIDDSLDENNYIMFPFSKEENERINKFLFSLGKSDEKTELAQIKAMKAYIENMKDKYILNYNSKSRVYITLGVGSGFIITLILI